MDEKQVRRCVIRWLTHLVQSCYTADADMVAMVLGIGGCGDLRSAAQSLISELVCSVVFGVISFAMWFEDRDFRDIGLATALCLLFLILYKLECK